ncbi:Exosome complex component RRP43 [Coelomomyces lativittatus]|nr:Exosome complex component RRP43 [Coelomomyces lativittatus]
MHSTSFNNHLLSTPPSSLHPLHHDPSSVLASTIQQLHPKEYLRRFLEKSIRPDARGVLEFRALAITQDGITTAEGSALVKLGQTTLLCVIKAEVAIPDLLAPQLGYLVPNIELTPLCSNQFKPGPPSPLAQSLSRFIADVHAKTPIIDLEQLCIDPGNAVWTLYADMYCLSYHGNILDAAWIALISALHSGI